MIWINAGRSGAEHESFVRSDSIPLPLSALDNANVSDGPPVLTRKEPRPYSPSAGAPLSWRP